MDKSLLFQVEHIWFQGEFPIISVFLALIITIIFFIFKNKKKKYKPQIQMNQKIIFPELNDKNFEKNIFLLLQNLLIMKYAPQNSKSHTNIDIAKYCNNKNIIKTYKNLEQIIYINKNFSLLERGDILQEIKNFQNDNISK